MATDAWQGSLFANTVTRQYAPPATDANHVLGWSLSGTSGAEANIGSGGTYPLNEVGTPGRAHVTALLAEKSAQTNLIHNSYFSTPRATPTPYTVPSPFTADVYFRPAYVTVTSNIFHKKDVATSGWATPWVVFLIRINGYQIEAAVVTGTNVVNWLGNTGARTDQTVSPGIWHHAGLTFNNADGVIELWYDGYMIDTVTAASTTLDTGNDGEYCVGGRALDSAADLFYGEIYMPRLSDTVRADSYFQESAQVVGVFV